MRFKGHVVRNGAVRLSEKVRLRAEYFGGIVFHKDTGDILEVDHEAFMLLLWLRENGHVELKQLRHYDLNPILPALITMSFIEYLPDGDTKSSLSTIPLLINTPLKANPLDKKSLSAPETAHLAVTYKCDESCPDCYSRRHASPSGYELDTSDMCKVIDTVADNNIFQLAIGGGEPFARHDLADITGHARDRGLVIHLTTGQYSMKYRWAEVLRHIKSLHIGIRSEELVNDSGAVTQLREIVGSARSEGFGVGANLIMTRFTIANIDTIMELLSSCEFDRLIFLRYKPIDDRIRWNNENPCADELTLFQDRISRAKQQNPRLMLRVDCAAAFLMRDVDPVVAKRSGLRGCTAGERIISIAPDGTVYPCSQLVGDSFRAGNLMSDPFETIWQNSGILNKLRDFRQTPSFADSACGKCYANALCGGCRVFLPDSTGGETVCPIA